MKFKVISLVCILSASIYCKELNAQVIIPSKAASENVISLNGLWKFKYLPSSQLEADSLFYDTQFDIASWSDIKTPGHWELQGFAEPFYGKNLKEGTGLYRTSFIVPFSWNGSPVYIAFDGVQYGYTLWVNGHFAGSFASSYNRQTFDITSFVKPGKSNILAVKVSTRSKGWEFDTNDCWSLSGIIRDVTLFSLPSIHIQDLVIQTFLGKNNASISIKSIVEKSPFIHTFPPKLNLQAQLFDPMGKLVRKCNLNLISKNANSDTLSFIQNITLENALLWTAETPDLYTLKLSLSDNAKEIQQYSQRIGIRQIAWDKGILKINGTPVKLRGVDHHDLSPVNGRALTENEILQDLKLIREANINFIRTSHYPPHPRLLDFCDSLGIYVMDEVPFGFGDEHLNDTSYLPILKLRAKATVWRDKNHPCIIVWSVGNENPLTKMCQQVGKYVKLLDATRPYCFPQIGSYFSKLKDNFPDSIDILSPHYPVTSTLQEYSNKFNRPMIVTEYAHALGLDFDRLESLWEIMYASPKLAGGAVWDFADQGILRKSNKKVSTNEFTTSVWLDSVTLYDNHGNEGADGIVYANRIPQVDYWQVRKVYSPVKAIDDTFFCHQGTQTITIKLINRFDFTNLNKIKCQWQFFADTIRLSSGQSPLNCQPHDTLPLSITLNIPDNPKAVFHYLKIAFFDTQNYQFYEKTFPVKLLLNAPNLSSLLFTTIENPKFNDNKFQTSKYSFEFIKESGMVKLKNSEGSLLITDGPWARVGRKTTMSEQANNDKATPENAPLWNPYLLCNPSIKMVKTTAHNLSVNYQYEREYPKGQFILGKIDYNFSDSGYIQVHYHLVPDSAKGKILEGGISFLIPSFLTEFRWIGKGPYPAYPGKNRLDEFGFFHLNKDDINYQGNRQDVEIAIFSDINGNGFAIISNGSNIAVERSPQGIIVSHNALVAGRFNKFSWPEVQYTFDKIKDISGNFIILPLNKNWPATLQSLLGKPDQTAVPFKPFYHGYDQ